jgi:hypothetical protein
VESIRWLPVEMVDRAVANPTVKVRDLHPHPVKVTMAARGLSFMVAVAVEPARSVKATAAQMPERVELVLPIQSPAHRSHGLVAVAVETGPRKVLRGLVAPAAVELVRLIKTQRHQERRTPAVAAVDQVLTMRLNHISALQGRAVQAWSF